MDQTSRQPLHTLGRALHHLTSLATSGTRYWAMPGIRSKDMWGERSMKSGRRMEKEGLS